MTSSVLKIKANDIDESIISKIKNDFKDKEILITEVGNVEDLEQSIGNIESGKNIISFTVEEFEKYSEELVRDKNGW